MKAIFFGLGSIGQRHAKLLLKLYPEVELFAYRTRRGQKPVADELRDAVHGVYSWSDVDAIRPDVAFVCNPTAYHVETALKCAKRGMHLFIEKPLGYSVAFVEGLLRVVEEKGLSTYVAYPLRFHPQVRAMEVIVATDFVLHARIVCSSYLPDWRPGTNHRESYSASEAMGGGALLDLSHEAYYAQQVFGPVERIAGTRQRLTEVTNDTDDCANLIMWHESGVVSTVHVNFCCQKAERYCELMTEHKAIRLNITFGGNTTEQMFIDQLKHFFGYVRETEVVGRLRMPGDLFESVGLFRKLVKLRGETQI